MAQAKYRGRFVWQELMTEDTAAAATFYTKLLGWQAQPSQVDASYTQLSVGAHGVAGMMKLPDSAKSMGAKPMWMPYITVDEVDAAITQLETLGGRLVRPASDIPTVGRFAAVADPQGAVFALIKPDGPPPGPAKAPVPGEFSWVELATTDHEAAFTFYSKLFGWQALHRHDMGPMGTYLIFGSDGVQQGGMIKLGAERGSKPAWLAYAAVADADLCAKEIPGLGGRVLNGPMDVPGGGRIVQLADPQGVMFAIHAQSTRKMETAVAKPAAPRARPAAPKAAPKPPVPRPPALEPVAPKAAATKPAAVAPAKVAPAKVTAAKTPAAKPVAASVPAAKVAKKAAGKAAKKKVARKVVKKAVKKAAKKKLPKKASKSVAKKKTSAAARKSASKPVKQIPSKKDKKHKKKDKKKHKKNKKSGKGKRKK